MNSFFNRFDQSPAPPPAQSPLLQPPLYTPPVHFPYSAPYHSLTTFRSKSPDTSSTHPVPYNPPPPTPTAVEDILVSMTPHSKELNSYSPVALICHMMKMLEKLALVHLQPLVSSYMDPLQSAYQPVIAVDDPIIYLAHISQLSGKCSCNPNTCHLQKFSDGSVAVSPLTNGDDREYIQRMDIETVNSYKYLGVHLTINWTGKITLTLWSRRASAD